MIFNSIVGHKRALELLKRIQAPTLIFAGPSGVGKKLAALALTQKILCRDEVKPCGKCSSCLRVEKKQHPDLFILESGDSPTIKIEQVRDLQNFLSLKAFEGQAKIAIIDEAHRLTTQGSNALLKTIEEPHDDTYIFLVTSNRSAILPTIQSRCQRLLFGELSLDELKQVTKISESWILELAQGRADLAMKITDEETRQVRQQALRALRDLDRLRTFEGFSQLEKLSEERETALFTLRLWTQCLKHTLCKKLGARQKWPNDENLVIEDLSSRYSTDKLFELSAKLQSMERDIVANVNKNLLFETFFLESRKT